MADFFCSSCGIDFQDSAPENAMDWKPRCPRCLRVSAVEARVAAAPVPVRKKPRFLRIWVVAISLILVVGMIVGVAFTDTSEQAQAVGEIAGGAIGVVTLVALVAWISWQINRIGERKPRRQQPPEP